MQDSLDKRYEKELTFDLPISIHGLELYPIKLKDYIDFMRVVNILALEKNSISPLYIPMSYLEFIIEMMKDAEKGIICKLMLFKCFSLATNNPNINIAYGIDEKGKNYIKIGDVILYSSEFDDIRRVVLCQNLPDYKENNIKDADLKKDLEEYEKLMNKNKKWASLECQIISVQLGTSLPLKYIYEMTIRKFILTLRITDKKLHYIIYKNASMSGLVKFKHEIEHYMIEDSNGIEDKVVEADAFINKIQSANL